MASPRDKFYAIGQMLQKMTPTEREPVLKKCIDEHINRELVKHGFTREQLTPAQLKDAEGVTRALLVREWNL